MRITTRETQEEQVRLTDLVRVQRRYLRSVNLERDFYTSDPLEGYVLTPAAMGALERLAVGVEHPYARAINITGPYGAGKSAFALFAAKALAHPAFGSEAIRERVRMQEPSLARRLVADESSGYWPILITGSRESVATALMRGLISGLERIPDPAARIVLKELRKKLASTLDASIPTPHNVTHLYETACRLCRKKSSSCQGLLVVIDEAGKFLEYAAIHPKQGDMQVLQEMAEFAVRTSDAPLMFVTILHQAFEDYAHRLSATQRNEWQKVQGRFDDIPFGDGPEETVRLIAQAMEPQPADGVERWLEPWLANAQERLAALHLMPATVSSGEFRDILRRTYPLHPLTLRITPYLFKRFGQSERSLFSFLSSQEPFGFQDFLNTHTAAASQVPTLRIDHLYDYIVSALGSTLYSHPTAKLWSEAEESLFRLRDRDPLQSRLLKTIAVLHILGEQTRILPTRDVLAFALADETTGKTDVNAAIDALEAATYITYRQFKKAYRLYEGSDVDIEARLRDAKVHFSQGLDTVRVARHLEATPPIVARRHSYEKGTLRSVDVRYCRPSALEEEIVEGYGRSDGLLLMCLASDASELEHAQEKASNLVTLRPDVIIGLSIETEALHESGVVVESLLWVKDNTPELGSDKVAMREVSERLLDAKGVFRTEWARLLRPQETADESSIWYYLGEVMPVTSYRHVQELVSRACDRAYSNTPKLINELINRRQPSSAGASGRRLLIEAMIMRRSLPLLGIDGFPAERSMYESVLRNTGIHRKMQGDTWGFHPPDLGRDEALAQIWEAIENFLFDGPLEPKPLAELNAILRAQPFGLTEGVIPVLLCAVLLYNETEVGLYEEGRFVTDLDTATFERMIKQPGDFTLQGCRVTGERRAVLERFGRGLLHPGEQPTVMNIGREIYRAYKRLPEYTMKTRKFLTRTARSLRDVLKEGREPEQLLFVDLPRLFNAEPFVEYVADNDNANLFFTQWNTTYRQLVDAYDGLLRRIEQITLDEFEVGSWEQLRIRAAIVLPYITESALGTFVRRASDETADRTVWLESVATGVLGRHPASWSDADEGEFANALPTLVSAFQSTQLVVFQKKQQVGGDNQVGVRIAVTLDTGAEEARVIISSRDDADRVEALALALTETIVASLLACPPELRLAVVARATQNILREEHND